MSEQEQEQQQTTVNVEKPKEEEEEGESAATGQPKDTLVVYFSRTGVTKKVAEKLAAFLGADIEEVVASEDLLGAWNYMKLAYRAFTTNRSQLKVSPAIKPQHKTIWIGGPVHASALASPLFSWIEDNKDALKEEGRQVFLFATEISSGHGGLFAQAETLLGTKVERKFCVFQKQVDAFDPAKTPEVTGKIEQKEEAKLTEESVKPANNEKAESKEDSKDSTN